MTDIELQEIAKRDAGKVRELSELARKFLIELNGEQNQFELEEVIHGSDGRWIVTVSYFRKVSDPNDLQKALGLLGRRVYKRITIDWKTKQVLGMSDWSPEHREAA